MNQVTIIIKEGAKFATDKSTLLRPNVFGLQLAKNIEIVSDSPIVFNYLSNIFSTGQRDITKQFNTIVAQYGKFNIKLPEGTCYYLSDREDPNCLINKTLCEQTVYFEINTQCILKRLTIIHNGTESLQILDDINVLI